MTITFSGRTISRSRLFQYVFFGLTITGTSVNLYPCQAQLNSNQRIDYTQKGAWRNPYDPQTRYLLHVDAIKHQIRSLLKPLSQLSVMDPDAYSSLQADLHAYLHQLEQQKPDYGETEVHQEVQLRLVRFDDQIKAALVESRRIAHEEGQQPDETKELTPGHKATVRPYALLFNKPDYHSLLLHIILPRESVTILKNKGAYCLVQCSLYKGYLSKGMIVECRP